MSWELFYTSAPRGLRLGSRGFCTVARTEGMPAPLIDRLESLSAYHPVTEPAPALLAHWRISVAGRTRSILSRVALAGSDYSGRLNKLAYHLVLDPKDQAEAGPAALLVTDGVMQTEWEGEPRLLKPRMLMIDLEAEDPPPNSPSAHQLADAFVADSTKSACIVYPPGVDPLPLLRAALSMLEPRLRWQVTFSTCFSELAAGLTCNWRCVPVGSPAAAEAHRHATSGVVIHMARQGS